MEATIAEKIAVPVVNSKESNGESLFKDDLYQDLFLLSSGRIDILKHATEEFVKAASASK